MNLVERFKLAAKTGMTGLTIWSTSKGWQVSIRFDEGWYISTHEDLEEGLLKALGNAKRVKNGRGLPDHKSCVSPSVKRARRKQRRLERKKLYDRR